MSAKCKGTDAVGDGALQMQDSKVAGHVPGGGALETRLQHCTGNADGNDGFMVSPKQSPMQKYEIIESKQRDSHCVAIVKRREAMFVA